MVVSSIEYPLLGQSADFICFYVGGHQFDSLPTMQVFGLLLWYQSLFALRSMIPPFRSEPSLHLLMKTDRIRSLHIFMKSARIRIFGIIFCLGSLPMRFCRAPTVFNVICKAFQGCPLVLTHHFETASVAARKNLGTGTIPNIPITSLSMFYQINSSSVIIG